LSQTISIKIINADNGKPLAGKVITVERGTPLPQDPGTSQAPPALPKLELKTMKEGIATFQLSELGNPPPEKVMVIVTHGSWAECSPYYAPVEDITHLGIVSKNYCESAATKKQTYTARPGELIFFTRHIGLVEKVKNIPIPN
jgi:hypothetical protein